MSRSFAILGGASTAIAAGAAALASEERANGRLQSARDESFWADEDRKRQSYAEEDPHYDERVAARRVALESFVAHVQRSPHWPALAPGSVYDQWDEVLAIAFPARDLARDPVPIDIWTKIAAGVVLLAAVGAYHKLRDNRRPKQRRPKQRSPKQRRPKQRRPKRKRRRYVRDVAAAAVVVGALAAAQPNRRRRAAAKQLKADVELRKVEALEICMPGY